MTGKDEHRKGGNIVFVLESYDEDLHISAVSLKHCFSVSIFYFNCQFLASFAWSVTPLLFFLKCFLVFVGLSNLSPQSMSLG